MSKKKTKKRRAGRPPRYRTPTQLQKKIDEYFDGGYRTKSIKNKNGEISEVPDITITDLVIFLGFCSRQSFYDYEKKDGFAYTIKRARTFIEREYESLLKTGNCTGAIFALKNFGWTDKSSVELESKGKFGITWVMDEDDEK